MNENTSKNLSKTPEAEENFDKSPLPEKIGKNLRKIYDDVLNEPVPDDFLSLLAQADKKKK